MQLKKFCYRKIYQNTYFQDGPKIYVILQQSVPVQKSASYQSCRLQEMVPVSSEKWINHLFAVSTISLAIGLTNKFYTQYSHIAKQYEAVLFWHEYAYDAVYVIKMVTTTRNVLTDPNIWIFTIIRRDRVWRRQRQQLQRVNRTESHILQHQLITDTCINFISICQLSIFKNTC